jgi:hypothetical protein
MLGLMGWRYLFPFTDGVADGVADKNKLVPGHRSHNSHSDRFLREIAE